MKRIGKDRPVYMISVAAELAGVHPQTLRIYERKALVCPKRSAGNTRLYSEADVERLRYIQHLTQAEGVNLAGVIRIIELQREVERLHRELDETRRIAVEAQRAAENAGRVRQTQAALVRITSGSVARRSGGGRS